MGACRPGFPTGRDTFKGDILGHAGPEVDTLMLLTKGHNAAMRPVRHHYIVPAVICDRTQSLPCSRGVSRSTVLFAVTLMLVLYAYSENMTSSTTPEVHNISQREEPGT